MLHKEDIINDLVINKDHFKSLIKTLKGVETFHHPLLREEVEKSFNEAAKWLIIMDINKRLNLPLEDIICTIEDLPLKEYLK